jgi:hypothetical protein
MTSQTGGRFIESPISYAQNTTVGFIGRGGEVSIADTDFLTVCKYNWAYIAGSIIRYGVDDLQNRGKDMQIKLVNAGIDNLKNSISDLLEEYLFNDGSVDDSIEGLGNLVAASPATGTVGGLNRATYEWFRNRTKASTGAASLYLLSDMENLYNTIQEGKSSQAPEFSITDQTVFELYKEEAYDYYMTQSRELVNLGLGGAGFDDSVKFRNSILTYSPRCTAGYIYMLHHEALEWVYDPSANFSMTEWKSIPGQVNDRVAQILVAGNLISPNPRNLGVLTGNAA